MELANNKFVMGDRTFEIELVSQDELHNHNKKINDGTANYFGMFLPYSQKILLSKELTSDQQIKTLIHELTHCYLWCYSTPCDSYDEEDICNICSNSLKMIFSILYYDLGLVKIS